MKYASFFKRTKIQVLIIVVLTFLAYSNIFQNSFIIDDEDFIVNWKEKQEITNIPLMLKGNNPPKFGGIYRPVRGVMYTLYHQIFGTNPFGYHLHSILVHLGSTILVYLIVRELVYIIQGPVFLARGPVRGQPHSTSSFVTTSLRAVNGAPRPLPPLAANIVPFVTALFFGLHPVHTESITFMTSAMDMTGVLFLFAAFYLYLIEKKIYSYIFASLAFFSYEPALVLIPLLFAFDVLIRKIPLREIISNIKKYLPYIMAGLAYIFIRLVVIGRNPTHFKYLADSFYHTQLMMAKIFVKYLSLLIAPFNLSLNHMIDPGFETFNPPVNDFQQFSSQSIFNPWIIISILIIITLVFITIKFINKASVVSFGLVWILISFLPYGNLVPQPTPLAERYLYLASFGFVLVLVFVLSKINQRWFLVGVLGISLLYGGLTFDRNFDWKDQKSIWGKVLLFYPESAFANYILATNYQDAGENERAVESFQKTLTLKPKYISAYLELGRLYHKNNQTEKALEVLAKATQIEVEPIDRNRLDASIGELAKIYTEIGFIYKEKNQFEDAYTNFEQALSLYPGYPVAKFSIDVLVKEHPQLKQLAKIYTQENWVRYRSDLGLIFEYPKDWVVEEAKDKIHLFSKDKHSNIEISIENYSGNKDGYLKIQQDEHGTLVNQRYTRLPGADEVFAKVWNDKNIPKIQFYVFKPKNVIKLFIYPSEVSLKVILEGIMRTIKTES